MSLFTQALTIMSIGMALVFAFLAMVIWGMVLSARVIRRYEANRAVVAGQPADVDPGPLVAAIAVAVVEHPSTP